MILKIIINQPKVLKNKVKKRAPAQINATFPVKKFKWARKMDLMGIESG